MSCKGYQILNPLTNKCVSLKSQKGQLIQYYQYLTNASNVIGEEYIDESNTSTFYDIIKQMTRWELLVYLSDLQLKQEAKSLLSKYPNLPIIDIVKDANPITTLLEEYLMNQPERGQLFETIWDIFIKLGISNFGNDYFHVLGNVNFFKNEVVFLENKDLPEFKKNKSYYEYFNTKCISGNSTGVSDISLQSKKLKKQLEACEDIDITSREDVQETIIYISCKYYIDDSRKRITEYDIQNILSLIKNKIKLEVETNNKLTNYKIYLFVKDKLKVKEVLNAANKSSEYLRKNVEYNNIWDLNDLNSVFWNFIDLINNYKSSNKILDNNIFKLLSGQIKKPILELRFHQKYAIEKTLKNIGKAYYKSDKRKEFITKPRFKITQVWGMIPRSGKTYTAGGLIYEYSKQFNFEPCRTLVITSAPTETKGQWLDELFKKYKEFEDWDIKEINRETLESIKNDSNSSKHLVYVVSKQFLDIKEDGEISSSKLTTLIDISNKVKFNLIIFDENHLGGTTKKAKESLDRFGSSANKILLTATFNKSIDKFEIPLEHLITWDLSDISLCKQFNDPRKMLKFIENHSEDKPMLEKLFLKIYNIDINDYIKNNTSNSYLEEYYLIKGREYIQDLYLKNIAENIYNDLSLYPDSIKELITKYDIDLDVIRRTGSYEESLKHKINNLCDELESVIDKNNKKIVSNKNKINFFIKQYELYPELHFIGLNFANEKLKKILSSSYGSSEGYGYSMNALFKTNANGTAFENSDAINKVLNQISGGGDDFVPQDKSLYASIEKISLKYQSRTMIDTMFTSQLWFIPFGGQNTRINDVSKLLKELLNKHSEFKKYHILSLYDEDADKNKNNLKGYIKTQELLAKNSGKKGLIILSGEKLRVGVSLKCVDIVFLMNDVTQYDVIYQSMFRALTESKNKKIGYIVDLNPTRLIEAIYEYSDRSKSKVLESPLNSIKKNIQNLLFYVDDYLFEYDDSIERSNQIIKIISDINKDNPNLTTSMVEKKLASYIDNIDFDLETLGYLSELFKEAKDVIEKDSKKQVAIHDLLKELIGDLSKGMRSENSDSNENAGPSNRGKSQKEKMTKVNNAGAILMPFIKLFIILSIDDPASKDIISMYRNLTDKQMIPILIEKLKIWGITDYEKFLNNFGKIILHITNSSQNEIIDSAIKALKETVISTPIIKISKKEKQLSNISSNITGGSQERLKLEYILNNIYKTNVSFKQFNRKLKEYNLCNDNKQAALYYNNNYLSKYNYLF